MGKSEYKKVSEAKKKAKEQLYKRSYPGASADHNPMLIVLAPQGKNSGKERELLFQLLEGLAVLPCEVVVVDDDEPSDDLKRPSGKFTWVNNRGAQAEHDTEQYLLCADMALVFDEDHNMLNRLMGHGVVIVGHDSSPFLQNYHPNEETGNSFTFAHWNPWDMFRAVVRACETYRFPYDWGNIVRGILKK